ncbi:MAG: ECF transporter S component [Spirochaetaceae bacterium]|nr:ECF transporter S component [Spirochaetaceae bacterium]
MSKTKISRMTLFLIPVCIAINLVGGQLAIILKLPVYLDAIGTIIAGGLCGPIPGVAVGLLTNLINAISLPTVLGYAVINVVFGLVSAFLSRKKMFTSLPKILCSAVIFAVLACSMAIPITVNFFGGFVGTGATVIVSSLMAMGWDVLPATVVSELSTELLDKFCTMLICFFILKSISSRFLVKLPYGEIYIKKSPAANPEQAQTGQDAPSEEQDKT